VYVCVCVVQSLRRRPVHAVMLLRWTRRPHQHQSCQSVISRLIGDTVPPASTPVDLHCTTPVSSLPQPYPLPPAPTPRGTILRRRNSRSTRSDSYQTRLDQMRHGRSSVQLFRCWIVSQLIGV